MPIHTFADERTADVFYGRDTKAARTLPAPVRKAAKRRLDALNAATSTLDLSAVPGNRFESLKHTMPGFYSIRVNDQFRVLFRFENGAFDVQVADYHGK